MEGGMGPTCLTAETAEERRRTQAGECLAAVPHAIRLVRSVLRRQADSTPEGQLREGPVSLDENGRNLLINM